MMSETSYLSNLNHSYFVTFRLREPVRLVKGATRRTHCAVVVAESPFMSKRKFAHLVDILEQKFADTDGLSRLQDATQPVPAE